MKCEICQKGIADGVSLFRQNAHGEVGIWRCREHNGEPIDPEVDDLVSIIQLASSCPGIIYLNGPSE